MFLKRFKTPAGRATTTKESGFSRVDLIAVVVMLGVLTSIAVASMTSTRIGGQSAACLENLRKLTRAWQQFDFDHGYLPPNPDDGNITPGLNWVSGSAGSRNRDEFNPDILMNSTHSLLAPYLIDASVFRCPDDLRKGLYSGTDLTKKGTTVSAARSYTMNGAVGSHAYVKPSGTAPDGPWLDNSHAHYRYREWRTYGQLDHIVDPSPSSLAVLMDEDSDSLNDGNFGFGMAREEWIDWPGTRHSGAAGVSFADGHAELHRWTDPRTGVQDGNVRRTLVPGSEDYQWLRKRISAPIPLNRPLAVIRPANFRPADVKLVWPATDGVAYRVEFSSDLKGWQTLDAPLQLHQNELSTIDPVPPADQRRFYRLVPVD